MKEIRINAQALRFVNAAKSQTDYQRAFRAVLINGSDLIATDGFRLAVARNAVEGNEGKLLIEHLPKTLTAPKSTPIATLTVYETVDYAGMLTVGSKSLAVTVRNNGDDVTFPDVTQVESWDSPAAAHWPNGELHLNLEWWGGMTKFTPFSGQDFRPTLNEAGHAVFTGAHEGVTYQYLQVPLRPVAV